MPTSTAASPATAMAASQCTEAVDTLAGDGEGVDNGESYALARAGLRPLVMQVLCLRPPARALFSLDLLLVSASIRQAASTTQHSRADTSHQESLRAYTSFSLHECWERCSHQQHLQGGVKTELSGSHKTTSRKSIPGALLGVGAVTHYGRQHFTAQQQLGARFARRIVCCKSGSVHAGNACAYSCVAEQYGGLGCVPSSCKRQGPSGHMSNEHSPVCSAMFQILL